MNNWSCKNLLLTAAGCYALSADAVLADATQSIFGDEAEAVSLLQLRSVATHSKADAIRARDSPGNAERQMCPHEIEEIESMPVFGTRGTLRAKATRECSFWGDPHISRSWPTQFQVEADRAHQTHFSINTFDILLKPGLFRMAAAKDGSWEVQVMNCGAYAASLAVRFGKTVIEIVSPGASSDDRYESRWDSEGGPFGCNLKTWGDPLAPRPRAKPDNPDPKSCHLKYFINGELYKGEFPFVQGDLFLDDSHRKIISDRTGTDAKGYRNFVAEQNGGHGAAMDDPGGQVYVEVYKNWAGNINVLMEAAEGSYTTQDTDPFSICNVELKANDNHGIGGARDHDWDEVQMVSAEDSLFIGSGSDACKYCGNNGVQTGDAWYKARAADVEVAQATCDAMTPKEYQKPTMEETCKEKGVALETAEAACVHLQNDPEFFLDCQLDFCASGGSPDAVANAEEEEHAENPQPICAIDGDTCNPAAACCSALKDDAILDFNSVVQNNLCGDGDGPQEIRYGSALIQQGQRMDLVVTPTDSHMCGRAVNAKNGVKTGSTGSMGVITIQAGTESTLNFAFVESGTNTPATPSSLMFSFFDLDQGKKNKQRESVEVCGALNAIVTDNSVLEQSVQGNCIKYTSTTAGHGKDNPEGPENLSHGQRAKVVAYQVAGSSFTATLGVSKKGHNPRPFLFAGHPSIACVLN